jgi:hypothetical protein
MDKLVRRNSAARLVASLILLGLIASACNMPRRAAPTESGAAVLYTAAAQTFEAQYTQVSKPPATQPASTLAIATGTTQGPAPSALPTNTLPPLSASPTATKAPPTVTPIPCDLIKFEKDVTIPDNTEIEPGATFVKTWRLQNAGSCTWTTGYALVFAGGDAMGAPASIPLGGSVSPGQTVDLSVTLTAPAAGGTYRGDWKLRNAAGVSFGLVDGSKAFWAQIKVSVNTGLVYDFLVQAGTAEWASSAGSEPAIQLTFGGADDDPKGVAKIKDAIKLENGATSGKVLLMVPPHDGSGLITGLFPAYKVQSGDHLRVKIGFMLSPGNACGDGQVKLQFNYKEGSEIKVLQDLAKTCTGNFLNVDIDLTSLKGKTVRFGFVVMADGDFTDDWVIFNSPRIEH